MSFIRTLNNPRGLSCCFGQPKLHEGATANTFKTVAAIDYCIEGHMYTKAATDNIAFTAATAQVASSSCMYLVTINAAGTVATIKGTDILTTDLDSIIEWPRAASGYIVIGAIRITTAAATTFTAGSTDLSASGITDAYLNLSSLPGDLKVTTSKFSTLSPTPSASNSPSVSPSSSISASNSPSVSPSSSISASNSPSVSASVSASPSPS